MIIEKIELKNFRAYKESEIELSKSKDKNITLIYGENGAGKTSLFYAINWCFYGRKFENKEIIPKNVRLDGKYLKKELNEGESEEVYVKITFSHKNERYNLIRKFKVIKKKGELDYGEEKVSLDSYSSSGSSKKYIDEEIDRKINSLIPVTTREYFFFDGEKIDRFSDVSNNREIESSIRAVLGLDCIKFAKGYLHDATKYFDKLITSKNNDEFNRIIKIIEDEESKINDYDVQISKLDEKKAEFLSELSILKKKADNYKLEKKNRDELNGIKSKINEKEKEKKEQYILLHDELHRSYYSFAINLNKECKSLMKKWDDDGVFPAEIFNEDLIDKTLDKCSCIICGNKFNEGDKYYQHVSSLKGDMLFSREIEKELNNFNSNIKDHISKGELNLNNSIHIYKRIGDLTNEIDKLISKRDSLKSKITQGIDDEKFREIFEKEHNLETLTIPDVKWKIKDYEAKKVNSLEDLKKFQKKKEKMKLISKSEQENKEKSDLCQKAENAIEYILKTYADEKRKEIDKLCRELFNSIIWKESHFKEVELTKDYLLKILDRFGEQARPDLSAGERQVLSLSFITAMAKSAEKEAPFIIDTPFGRISKKPRKYIAENIPNKVSQLVLFVTDTELTEESEKIFNSKSEKIFTLDFDQKSSITNILEGKHVD